MVIDVFRAFTCAPIFIHAEARRLVLAAAPEDGLRLKKELPEPVVLVGEKNGAPLDGYNFGNSPSQLLAAGPEAFRDKTVVLRTSAGVQGAIAALDAADEVLAGAFVTARATAEYIRKRRPATVSLTAMGWNMKEKAPEDECCARLLAHLLGQGEYDHLAALAEITAHESCQKFLRGDREYFPPADPLICLQRDLFDFALTVRREGGLIQVSRVD